MAADDRAYGSEAILAPEAAGRALDLAAPAERLAAAAVPRQEQPGPVFQRTKEDFECEHCGHLQRGTGYTNHCERCLWSKHVDNNPGDRAATCRGLMQPVAVDTKKGGYRILQRCLSEGCGHERWNKAQDGDDFDAILRISTLTVEVELEGGRGGRGGNGGKGKRQGGGRNGRGGGEKQKSKGGRKKCMMKSRR